MQDIKILLERLRENEAIAQKFHEVESRFLSILNFKDFFEVLLTEIIEKFDVPHVWITITDSSEISMFLEIMTNSEVLQNRINIIKEAEFNDVAARITRPFLANKNLDRFAALKPPAGIGSISIIPLSLNGKIIGTLNQADYSAERFKPGIDTSLLERLAVKVSLCISNVTAHEQLRYLAYHDPLTGLLNRRVMESVLQREFSRSKRYFSTLSIVFIDLDDFKLVNDKYGHDKGDELLKHVAGVFLSMTRGSDVIARFAGDEFVLVLPETHAAQAAAFMERVVAKMKASPLYDYNGEAINIAFSYGIASTDEKNIEDFSMLLKKADERLFNEKKERDDAGNSEMATKTA